MSQKKGNILGSIIDTIGNTPLVRINRLNKTSNEIVAKLESFNPAGSVKDRIAIAMVEDAEKKGLLKEGITIIEPTSGNTGIGLACVCASKGYNLIITMPESMGEERIKILQLFGAKVVLTPKEESMAGAIAKARQMLDEMKSTITLGQFENMANVKMHKRVTAQEIWDATNGEIDALVAGVGTGGTITGVGEFLKSKNSNIKIIAVEPAYSAVLSGEDTGVHKIKGIGAGFVPPLLNRDVIDEIITIKDEEAINMAKLLAEKEGILAGISSGAAMVAAIKLADKFNDKRIVVILPDTGERYLSDHSDEKML
jgi:cysteine synthase